MKRSRQKYKRGDGEMQVDPMATPTTRAEFERNLNLLRERFRQGRIFFASTIRTEGIQRARYLPNGRVDFLSVDESLRLQANMMAQPDMDMSPPEADLDAVTESEP